MNEHQPTAYGYGRVSSQSQFDEGHSKDAQPERLESYYNANLKAQGVEWGGCEIEPKGISAYKVSFFQRPAGSRLIFKLQEGDHLVVDKVDRIWRNVEDFVRLIKWLDTRGVKLHICDMFGQAMDMKSPIGEFVLLLLVGVARLESSIRSQRMKDVFAYLKAHGKIGPGERPPTGFKKVGAKPHRRLEVDEYQRALMGEVVRVKDENPDWNWGQVAEHINKRLMGDAYSTSAFRKGHLQRYDARRYYHAEIRLRASVIGYRNGHVSNESLGGGGVGPTGDLDNVGGPVVPTGGGESNSLAG